MFQTIRRRLLLSYLLVLGTILVGFAGSVRLVFTHSLGQQIRENLIALGKGASSSLELDRGQVGFKSDFPLQALLDKDQALEWFDLQGKSIAHQGHYTLSLPFVGKGAVQIQAGTPRIQGVTLPVMGNDSGRLMGYVRVSQSLEEFDEALRHLDWGMAGGIVIALGLTGVGGVVLTRQAMQPIERSFARLKQFTADASHELRSPLMAIASNAQVALRYPEGMRPGDAEKFAAIASAAKQLTRLTEDLLFLARMDTLPQQSHTVVDLSVLLSNLIQLYQPQATARSIHLELIGPPSLSMMGEETQLHQLFTNLIDNALRHTPVAGHIKLHSRAVGSQILITVEDTGTGIPPDQIERVFDRFWQAESSRSYESEGFGLGLAIARAIAKQHGGSITVTSQVNVGSCFTVCLPNGRSSSHEATENDDY